MHFRNVREYYNHVRSQVALKQLLSEYHKIQLHIPNRNVGIVRADSIEFSDGATLRFIEHVEIEGYTIQRHSYSYHYSKGEYFFRYDKDPLNSRPFVHAECHLHVNEEEPRYITHETSIDEILEFIFACFYP
jgi:transposase InsO family protein